MSESVKEMQITTNKENSEFKQDVSSEIKDNVYKCDQCHFTFKRKKNAQKHVNNKYFKNSIKCTKCKNSFDSEIFLKNHMNKKHNKIKNKSVHNDNYVTIKNNESELKISKDNDHEDYAEDSDNDSDSDTLEPYICPECGKECDDLENFSDHFKQVHNS